MDIFNKNRLRAQAVTIADFQDYIDEMEKDISKQELVIEGMTAANESHRVINAGLQINLKDARQQIDNLQDIVNGLYESAKVAADEVSFYKRSCILMEATIRELCKEERAQGKPDGTKKSS